MKLSVFIFFSTFLTIQANTSYSQKADISMKMNGVTVERLLEELESSTEYNFVYKIEDVDLKRTVSVDVANESIENLLDHLFYNTKTGYKIIKKQVFLVKQKPTRLNRILRFLQPKDNQLKIVPAVVVDSLTGMVVDESGNPLIGVNVLIKDSDRGVATDFDGRFYLSDVDDEDVLLISYIGYQTTQVPIEGKKSLTITLREDLQTLDEVVVVGYGVQRKSDLTGSVAQVKAADLQAYPSTGITQALQGRAAGVSVQTNNGGEPGSSFKVRVRGSTSINAGSDPLYVVDGFPGGSVPPAEDIASVEVLKDASAASIYGSRGANGVILITTKKGKTGAPMIQLNSSISSQKVSKYMPVMERDDYLDYINEIEPGRFDLTGNYPNTDWQREVFRNGLQQNHQLAVSGGADKVDYYLSGVIYDQEGIIINSEAKRYTLTSNFNVQLKDNIKLGANFYGTQSSNQGVLTQEGTGGSGNTGVVSGVLIMEPIVPIYNADGSYAISPTGDPHDNPVAIATERINESLGHGFQGNFFTEISLLKDFTWKSTLGFNNWSSRAGSFIPTTLNAGQQINGEGSITNSKSYNMVTEHYLTYSKELANIHNLTLLGGYSFQEFNYESSNAASRDFITDAFEYWNLGGGALARNPSSTFVESELASYFGRINYRLFDKYLLTLNARYDGSSRFAKNHKWAFFPSGAIAWNLGKEEFLKNIAAINEVKLRTSYGITGNQAIGAYQSLARFRTIPSTVINNTLVNAVAPNTVANNNLKWESTGQLNVGLDVAILDRRISFTAEYYNMRTKDLLFNLPLPQYSGYTSLLKNIGVVENIGYEFSISTVNIEDELRWTTDFNFSTNKNKIIELPNGNDIFSSSAPGHMVGVGATQVLRENYPTGQFFGYIYEGVYQEGDEFLPGAGFEQEAGGEKFKDLNGDGKLDNQDRTIIGDPNPDFTWGLNNSLEYKGFDLNVFVHGVIGGDIYSFSIYELETLNGYSNTTLNALNRWTPQNTNTDVPKANGDRARVSSDRFIYDGSFVRIKNISLGYSVPKKVLSRFGIMDTRLYVSGQNLWTITDYPGYDPEVNWRGSNTNQGMDYGGYPYTRSMTIGLQVKF
ncbi:TonB-dependent receptor [Membranihabitans marinus]|uniref:TonB-dependent receptor n=1 Tax=Membranihabitans marinus TaxID=1227546 RepID=UPI001F1A0623|nr:TonB-dependent receptor [Membranihabitans marinus]